MTSPSPFSPTPVIAIACQPFPSLRHLPLKRYPALRDFFSDVLPRFAPGKHSDVSAACVEYKLNGVTFEAVDDETWSVLQSLMECNRVSALNIGGVAWVNRKPQAKAGKAGKLALMEPHGAHDMVDAVGRKLTAKSETQALHDWKLDVMKGGQTYAWKLLPWKRRKNYLEILDLMEGMAGSSAYVVNPLYVVCPLCGKWVSMGRLCNRTLHDLCGTGRHLERHLNDSQLSAAAAYLLERHRQYIGGGCSREPLNVDIASALKPPPARDSSAFLNLNVAEEVVEAGAGVGTDHKVEQGI
jgi:hypothetical protein